VNNYINTNNGGNKINYILFIVVKDIKRDRERKREKERERETDRERVGRWGDTERTREMDRGERERK
jgi:hypothetical protein